MTDNNDDDPVLLEDAANEIITKSKPRHRFPPGNNANPFGRPKGSRNKLGEIFIAAMHDDFMEHGAAVIQTVRHEKPDQYLKVIASILPKELHVKDASLDDLSDEDLMEMLAAIREMSRKHLEGRKHERPRINAQLVKPKTVN